MPSHRETRLLCFLAALVGVLGCRRASPPTASDAGAEPIAKPAIVATLLVEPPAPRVLGSTPDLETLDPEATASAASAEQRRLLADPALRARAIPDEEDRRALDLVVQPIEGSRLVELQFRDGDPARARRLCRLLLDRYLAERLGEPTRVSVVDDCAPVTN